MAQQDWSRPQAPAKRREQPRHWLISTCQMQSNKVRLTYVATCTRQRHPAARPTGPLSKNELFKNRRQPYGPKEWAEPTPITGRLRERPTVVKSSLKRLTPIPA